MIEALYIHRELSKVIEEAASYFPAITITGPRQSGKTTLIRKNKNIGIWKLFKISYNLEKAGFSGTGFRILFARRGLFRVLVERCSTFAIVCLFPVR